MYDIIRLHKAARPTDDITSLGEGPMVDMVMLLATDSHVSQCNNFGELNHSYCYC